MVQLTFRKGISIAGEEHNLLHVWIQYKILTVVNAITNLLRQAENR